MPYRRGLVVEVMGGLEPAGGLVAAALAASLDAEKLILVTGAPGILEDRSDAASLMSYIDLAGLERLHELGSLAEGMLPKAKAIEAAGGSVA